MHIIQELAINREVKLQVLHENLQVLLESDIILLVDKCSALGNFSGRNNFSKIVVLIV